MDLTLYSLREALLIKKKKESKYIFLLEQCDLVNQLLDQKERDLEREADTNSHRKYKDLNFFQAFQMLNVHKIQYSTKQ